MARTRDKKKLLKWLFFGLLVLTLILYAGLKLKSGDGTLVRLGNPLSSSTKEFVFTSCGSRLPDYQYSVEIPNNWSVYRTTYDSASTYYEAKGENTLFTISCTNQGVGGGCDEMYHTKIKISGKEYEMCYQEINGKWNMSNLNFFNDSSLKATISFWTEGLDKSEIEELLSSFKRLTK